MKNSRRQLTLEAVNARLEMALIGVRVRQKGRRLYLVATLPLKPADMGKTMKQFKQYWVSLGVFANPDGIRYAESKAQALGAIQSAGFSGFSWDDWAKDTKSHKTIADMPATDALDAYKAIIFNRLLAKYNGNEIAAERQWRNSYWNGGLSKLADFKTIDQPSIEVAMSKFKPDSRSQQRGATVIGCFLEEMGIAASTKKLRGNYSPGQVKRHVPDDDVIYKTFYLPRLEDKPIRTVFALMAVFGLRDHECFKGSPIIHEGRVLFHVESDSKTGERWANSNPLRWAEEWHDVIMAMRLPSVSGHISKDYSSHVSKTFRRYQLGMTPYSLRHAYGLRGGQDANIPIPLLAKSMGNSAQTNERYYQKHGSLARQAEAWKKAEARSAGAGASPQQET